MELDLPQYEAVMLSDSDIASTVPSGYSPLGALQFDRDFTPDAYVYTEQALIQDPILVLKTNVENAL